MITTVTLNPAVDKTYTAARLLLGQVNRMDSVKNIAVGKGINVAKVLRQYDYPVKALVFMGGYTGRFIEDYAKEIGIQCHFTHVKGETRSSINILSQDGYVTEVLEPGPTISEAELTLFLEDYDRETKDSSLVILSGSAPTGIPSSIYKELIQRSKKQGKKVLLDTSGQFLKEGVMAKPFMIKPNVKELEILADRKLKGLEEIADAAVFLNRQGIEHILVSMGAKGLLYVREGEVIHAKAPKIKAVNTVGCGDSTVAAFAIALESGLSGEDMLRMCIGISVANAATLESAVIPRDLAEELKEKAEIVIL